jgi:uncharacterized membrane protein YdfJ with MMPL/SSD domain
MNLAERAGRWSAEHWKTATFGWLLLVVAAVAASMLAGTRELTLAESSQGGSARAERILARSGFAKPADESVLVQAKDGQAVDAAFRATVGAVVTRLGRLPQVEHLRSGTVSKDGRSQLIRFDVAGAADTADERIQPVLDAVSGLQRAYPAFTIAEFGLASANRAGEEVIGQDLHAAERLSVPVTFTILLVAFGAFVAAGIPVLLAFSAVLGALGLAGLVSHVVPASQTTSSIVLLMGMAVGVDYSLFYLRREREERARGRGNRDALSAAAATSGRAVLVSGLIVVVACAGMLLSGSGDFVSMGTGAILVVLVAMVGSLTVLPALLGRLGDRVEHGVVAVIAAGVGRVLRLARHESELLTRLRERRTLLQRAKGDSSESRVWALVLRPVLRAPRTAAIAAAGALIVISLPAFGMRTANPGADTFPQDLPIVRAFKQIERAFPGTPSPAEVIVSAPNVDAPLVRRGIADLERRALASNRMHAPIEVQVNPQRTVVRIDVPLAGSGFDEVSYAALKMLRSQVIPAAFGDVPDVEVAVTGDTAQSYDFAHTMATRTPVVVAFVLTAAFLLLLFAFRSLVVPLTAITLNLLSLGAAYGALVWIFQDGHLQGVLGFHSNGSVVTWMPLFLFTVLFGLSMDYHVFIVSRIRELVLRGQSTRAAVARGIGGTASTVTSAALVMVAVFAIFASTRTLILKELGVGLAIAVLVDATVIRSVLLPSVMTILGRWNWYLPRRLAWLPRLELEGSTARQASAGPRS